MDRTALVACLMLVLGLTLPDSLGAQDIARLQSGVVKIRTKPAEGGPKVGTGFIVRLEKDVAYIVTSTHVVAGDSDPKVEFFSPRRCSGWRVGTK
jgi:S1-C subfamily serine protease